MNIQTVHQNRLALIGSNSSREQEKHVGNHKIVFGGVENLESKFEKLMFFYKKGLNKTGWNEYSEINLKYKDQVVCTKRYN